MAITFTGPDFGTLVIPGAVTAVKVETPNAGLSTTGVLMLVGEAEAGPAATQEDDITLNSFGPESLAAVIRKYQAGPLVDAFRLAVSASNDSNISGSPSRIILAKTNVSDKAEGLLLRSGLSSDYVTVADLNYGELGNLINLSVTAVQEVPPTTGQFTYIPTPSTSTLGLRVNGGVQQNLTISAKKSPTALVGTVSSAAGTSFNSMTVSGLNNLHATGGLDRGTVDAAMVASGQTLAVATPGSSSTIVVTLNTGSWAVTPSVGDTLIIPATGEYGAAGDSAIDGATQANLGAYVVTAATSNTVTAVKLRNNAVGALILPESVVAVDIAAVTDFIVYSPVVVSNYTGVERAVLSSALIGQTVTGTASGSQLTLTLQTGAQWNALPQANDILLIPATAPAAWLAAGANGGWYRVVSATSGVSAGASTIVMVRLSNGDPSSFAATAIASTTDLRDLRPAIDGTGKALEIFDGGGAEAITTQLYNLSTSLVTWVSTAPSPKLLVSATEYTSTLNVSRQFDNVQEAHVGQPDIVFRLGYHGGGAVTSATATIANVSGVPRLTTSVSGGNGVNLDIDLRKYRTLSDLVTYIGTQTGYVSSVGSALYGQLLTVYKDSEDVYQTVLDKGTFGIASQNIAAPSTVSPAGRIKREAWALFKRVSENSVLIQLGSPDPLAATSGQPEVQSLFFLAGGTKGSTSQADVAAAIDEMEKVRGNFLVPLFSRDAVDDIEDGLTDSASSYEIDSINAYAKSHVLALSVVKRRRNRQAFLSKQDSFTNVKLAANNLASPRCVMTFQDFKAIGGDGLITQFQPWMTAVCASAMQAAGFYKPIFKKFMNTSGILMADGSYSSLLPTQVEDALLNGLLPAELAETGGFRWVSDQTTYAADTNFVYNSIQAVYVADVIALTLAQRLERAFVGQSLADISAGLILSFLTAVMADLKKLKLTGSSDDAPLGFKDATVVIGNGAAQVSLNIKLAGALYFIPITAYITQISQTASL